MKNIINIFKRDIKNIFTNWAATIVVIALIIIPSLYSLINISASWDPYENTKGLKVAVINEDKGTVFEEKDINLGNELVDKLKDNDKLGWVFVDKKTAKEGLLLEKYYATIEIPESFSEDATTITKKDVVKPKLIYTVNEKKNGIAAKITDSGVKSVKSQLDDNIVKSISGILFRICDEVGVDIKNNRPELRNIIDSVYKLDENMPELEVLLDEAINGTISTSELLEKGNEIIPVASDTLDATNEFIDKTQDYLDETQGDLDYDTPRIKEELIKSENLLDTSSVVLGNIDDKILPEVAKKTLLTVSDTAKATQESVNDAKSKLKKIKKSIDKFSNMEIPSPSIDKSLQSSEQIAKVQQSIDKQANALKNAQDALKEESKTISKVIDRLETVDEQLDKSINRANEEIQKLNNGEKLNTQNLTDTRKVLDDVHTLISDTLDKYDSEIVPTVNNGIDSMREISDAGSILTAQGKNILPDVQELINTFQNVSNLSNDQLNKLKEKFPDIKDNVHELAGRLKKIDNKGDIDELLDMITNNWEDQSDFLASPVEIQDNRLFSWPNYGSAVTPFYTVLCLWIGGYMLSIILGTDAHSLEEGKKLTHNELYFGRMLLFLAIGIGQAIVASTGALFLLKVYAVHPIMFVFYSIFVSVVFMIIIYTAVSIWGHTGIIIGVVLLVIQVAGTSGNFPIEVNPSIFQKIFPILPFNYAISGMRQVMAGIVYSILIRDSAILCAFMMISIIIGILFKKVTNKKRRKIVEKLKESSIMIS
ncbi:phage infection protein [Clostridium gelidum]|uniref:Phage infection protein n=1 Tax=Clostridium gelidum TaxID=704125 RepID=A0ABN6IXQ6_9CLOT|nr:YhgE/Pip domain-containing protein [Clostridium gelidum]BCZ45212.1 phage infection protein [Clostridium gelidum]